VAIARPSELGAGFIHRKILLLSQRVHSHSKMVDKRDLWRDAMILEVFSSLNDSMIL